MTLYNSIGRRYNHTRQPDSRIVAKLVELLDLPQGKTIADVGAGTGNYSNAIANCGYKIIAIEPSQTMQNQTLAHQDVSWIEAAAESIPLPDKAVDGTVVMLALHHFQDIERGIKEIDRITKNGKIVIFAFEQAKIPDFWLTNYFPYFIRDTLATFPSTRAIAETMEQITRKQVEIMPFLLPADLKDMFAAAGWRKPEIYLDKSIRNGISTFAKIPQQELAKGLSQLREDLATGVWMRKYGHLKQQQVYDAGYRILTMR
ncbi:MAG: class I SAM-dependent methyltransferase [Cyanobacteria bacterium P01_G01_bin.19]